MLARKTIEQYANAMQICPADSERVCSSRQKRGDAEARAGGNGMIARMVDLPTGIGQATYHAVPVRQSGGSLVERMA